MLLNHGKTLNNFISISVIDLNVFCLHCCVPKIYNFHNRKEFQQRTSKVGEKMLRIIYGERTMLNLLDGCDLI